MIKPAKPQNETERLQALMEKEILDTEPEEAFDKITKLASQICGTDYAVISLIDAERQWFKSKVGIKADSSSRDISFCGHAILENGVMEINDARGDHRFLDNPLVTEDPNIRFYAGAQLIDSNGFKLGTICVFDSKVKVLEGYQKTALETFAKKIIELIESRKKL